MKYKIAVAVGDKKAISQLKNSKCDLVEFRLDLISGEIEKFLNLTELPTILTARSKKEGGKLGGNKRNRVIERAIVAKPDFIDIELSSPKNIELAKENGVKTIISYHNFSKTPHLRRLVKKMEKASKFGNIVKIITMAKNIEDNLTMLKLNTIAKKSKIKIVSFCMGELGKSSRVLCPLFGSEFTFASLSKKTAPGQINLKDMILLKEMLG